MMRVNLIPIARLRARRRARRIRAWSVAWASCVAASASVAGWSWAAMSRLSSSDQAAMARVERRLEQSRAQTGALNKDLADTNTRLAAAESVGDRPDWSVLLAVIAREWARSDAISFESCSLVPERAEAGKGGAGRGGGAGRLAFRVSGVARSQKDVNDLVIHLEELRLFARVTFESRIREDFATPLVGFDVACTLADERGGP